MSNTKRLFYSVLVMMVLFLCHCDPEETPQQAENSFPELVGEYFGQEPPGLVPVMFDPGIFVHQLHTVVVFSPDGDESYWKEMDVSVNDMYVSRMVNGSWTAPVEVPFASDYNTGDPFFHPDGDRFFFTSQQPIPGIRKRANENIWFVIREGNDWSNPVPVDPVINRNEMHWQFSVAANGNLYFGKLDDNRDFGAIFVSEFDGQRYLEPRSIGEPISSPVREISEGTPYISPDESYLIFSRSDFRAGGHADLYISYKNSNGNWSPGIPMDSLNSPSSDLCARVTPDGRYLFFLSSRNGQSMPYWVSAEVIEDFRPDE